MSVTVAATYLAPDGTAAMGRVHFDAVLSNGNFAPSVTATLAVDGSISMALPVGTYRVVERVGVTSRLPFTIILSAPLNGSTFALTPDNRLDMLTAGILSGVAAAATVNGALSSGVHNPVDATAGNLTMTLPTAAAAGRLISIEKTDSTLSTVTLSGPIRGSTGTVALVWPHESIEMVSDSTGSWWPTAGHKTKSSLDGQYGLVGGQSSQLAMSALAVKRALMEKTPPQQVRWIWTGSSVAAFKFNEYFNTLTFALGAWSGSLGAFGGGNTSSPQTTFGVSLNSSSGTVVDNLSDYSVWWTGLTTTFGAAASRVYGQGGGVGTCDRVEVYYIGGTGVLGVQVDGGSVVSVDTSLIPAGTLGIYSVNPAHAAQTVTLSTVSGTPKVIGTPVAQWDSTVSGLIHGSAAQGGISLTSATAQAWTNYSTWLAHTLPDVITWEMKTGQWTQASLNAMLSAIQVGAPLADVVLLGSTPDSTSNSAQLLSNLTIAATARTFQAAGLNALYFDGFTPLGSWNRVNALGIGGDGIHLDWKAHYFLGSLLMRDMGILDSIAGISPLAINAPNGRVVGRLDLGAVRSDANPLANAAVTTAGGAGFDVILQLRRMLTVLSTSGAADGNSWLIRPDNVADQQIPNGVRVGLNGPWLQTFGTTLYVASARGGGVSQDIQARVIYADSYHRVQIYATAARPTAVDGAHIIDSTLGKPIWRIAGSWRDATGTVV